MQSTLNELSILLSEVSSLHTQSLNEELPEEVSDELYSRYWDKANEAAAAVTALIGTDEKTALKMVIHRRNEITTLLGKIA